MLKLDSSLLANTSSLVVNQQGEIFTIDHSNLNVLDSSLTLQTTIPFSSAFPSHQEKLEAIACDSTSNNIVALSNGRVAVWEKAPKGWRVHSSFAINHRATTIDFAHGVLAIGGDGISVWSLDESFALPTWQKVASEPTRSPVLSVKLSPSGDLIATVTVASNIVKLSQIQFSSSSSSSIRYLSHISHSTKIRNVGWRVNSTSADSGPILHTTTIDGHFRIWGCMIDEPLSFSLWATIDAHAELPIHIPISTNFIRTRTMDSEKENGTMDDFLTIFSDGSARMTTVTNFDSRPPTFLSQSSRLLSSQFVSETQFTNLRFTSILSSTDSSTYTLLGRCSKGTILSADLPNLDSDSKITPSRPEKVPINRVGRIEKIVPVAGGDVVIVKGDSGALQWWNTLEEGGVEELHLVQSVCDTNFHLTSWNGGRTVAIISPTDLRIFNFQSGRLVLASTVTHAAALSINYFQLLASGPDSTLLAGITSQHRPIFWRINSKNNAEMIPTISSTFENSQFHLSTFAPWTSDLESTWSTISEEGKLQFWSISLPINAQSDWKLGSSVRTGKSDVSLMECNRDLITAIISSYDGVEELSIWDSKESQFASGLQFSRINSSTITSMKWSSDGVTLALASNSEVTLMCSQRLDDLSDSPSWISYATTTIDHFTSSPIASISWLPNQQLSLCFDSTLLVYSRELEDGRDCHHVAATHSSPLPYHHPQLLFQSLLHGKTNTVIKILVGLARQLTEKGDLTPIDFESHAPRRIQISDFLSSNPETLSNPDEEIFSALANQNARSQMEAKIILTEDDTVRLLATLAKNSLSGLSKLEHAHLAVLVQTIYEIQTQQNSLDANGLRYLISMRSFFIYDSTNLPKSITVSRLKYRDIVWAYHSDSQEVLLEASIKACPGKLTWENAKALGIFLWISSPEVLARQMDIVGRNEYTKSINGEKDPISATLFYLALKKKHMVLTLWKQAGGHSDQRAMTNLLMNDFEEPRWKSAALKNAYALLSKRRFHFAAAFFLLGGSLKDAVNVCLRQIDDFQLAIAITRAYEGDESPGLRMILEEYVLPFAFKVGFRWLASWSFWMLKRRDLAVQVIITPLRDLATKLPYKLDIIGSLMHEDPALVLLYSCLRSYSLQTVKGAIAVPGQTEFNFVLHIARVLSRMGCQVLALDLVREWKFLSPTAEAPEYALRRNSTKFDVPTRVSTPVAAVLKRVATAAPAEFNMDSFAF